MTRFSFSGTPCRTRGWVCTLLVQSLLGLARAVTFGSKCRKTHDHILLSHLRLPNLEGQVSVFISPRNRVAQLYPQALGYFSFLIFKFKLYCDRLSVGQFHNHILLSHPRLPQPGGPGSRIYDAEDKLRPTVMSRIMLTPHIPGNVFALLLPSNDCFYSFNFLVFRCDITIFVNQCGMDVTLFMSTAKLPTSVKMPPICSCVQLETKVHMIFP
jgi:hypothetical protein